MTSLAEGARAFQALAKTLPAASAKSVKESVAAVRASVLVEQGRAGASTGMMRGVGVNGAHVGVVGRTKGDEGVVFAFGPAHLLDHPTKPRTIVPKRKRAMSTPFGPRAAVQHPGTRGKFYFEAGVAAAEPLVAAIFDANTDAAIVKGML